MEALLLRSYKVLDQIYKSRRGDYRLTAFSDCVGVMTWKPEPLGVTPRAIMVMSEVAFAERGELAMHPWWADEPQEFIDEYTKLYQEMFGLKWLGSITSRHNVVANATSCLTLVQYNNGILHAYSRSTDMRNGYYSDKLVLDYLAEIINRKRPDCAVDEIRWYLAVPHVYVEKGIARLKRH